MKKNSLQSYKVQYRTKTELKTMNQVPKLPLRMSSLVVVILDNREKSKFFVKRNCEINSTILYRTYCHMLQRSSVSVEKIDTLLAKCISR